MSRNLASDKKKLLEKLKKLQLLKLPVSSQVYRGVPIIAGVKMMKTLQVDCDEAIEHSAGLINDMAESQLISAIKDKNMSAIFFWLKHHHKTYKTRIEVNAKLQTIQQELTPEQTEVVSRALQLAGLPLRMKPMKQANLQKKLFVIIKFVRRLHHKAISGSFQLTFLTI
jgi:hypothetical protein